MTQDKSAKDIAAKKTYKMKRVMNVVKTGELVEKLYAISYSNPEITIKINEIQRVFHRTIYRRQKKKDFRDQYPNYFIEERAEQPVDYKARSLSKYKVTRRNVKVDLK